ncbi:MAG: tRNA-dihydrouridine synthase [bacterium]|nr:tRNA-dihydrouridine synthase [bacterium]
MSKNFWKTLNKPIICLAPMADVTDAAFRFMIAKYGKPDIMWTEFVSVDGLCSAGKEKLLLDLKYSEKERPIVAQIFGSQPENFTKVARLLKKLKFDGIDINMGCPDKKVEKQGAGAALIKNPKLAQEIILAAKKGAGGLPVSVKTRIGYNKIETEEWVSELLKAEPAAIILHLRTRKEMSKVPAHWEEITKAVALSRQANVSLPSKERTLIIGNGDVKTPAEGVALCEKYGCDGVMIGRGIFGNPWLFSKKINSADLTLEKKLKVMTEHAKLYEQMFHGKKNFLIMRKHLGAYIKGFDNIKKLRVQLMATTNAAEVLAVAKNYLQK